MNPYTGRKSVLLTGATGQLGSALIDALSSSFDIIALTRQSPSLLPRLAVEVFDAENNSKFERALREVSCDLSDMSQIISTVTAISALVPRVDHVINCAGDSQFLGNMIDAHFIADAAINQFRLHVIAPAVICSVLFHSKWKHMKTEDRSVSIVNVSSISGLKLFPDTGQGMYAASKSAENMATIHMASEYSRYGIRVNAVCPTSFPGIIPIKTVVDVIVAALDSQTTGQLYKIDAQ
ncbi:SDR family oxidoreductase [Methylobacterium oryzae]|uniref:SDR family oxidoreductase n=1 Tax=Methylobacterium oryzae TaxID=334852 RepID=UPI001F42CEED|nr:SDR family oxidoreductase [Methylobacterium oryzae]UIN38435.1 SDR family oxidoreductase [Methylobacterium oryzae]